MKKIILVFIAASFIFASCQKSGIEEIAPSQNETEKSMETLNVSPDFDWKTSADVEISLDTDRSGVVYINSEDGDTYQKAFLKGNTIYETSITIPTYAKEVQFKFDGKLYFAELTGENISLGFN